MKEVEEVLSTDFLAQKFDYLCGRGRDAPSIWINTILLRKLFAWLDLL